MADQGPWGSRASSIAGLFELSQVDNGHCIIVSTADASVFLQVMVFPDGMVYMEMSEHLASVVGHEQLADEGWTLPEPSAGTFDDQDFAHPSRVYDVGEMAAAAAQFCAEVDRMAPDGVWEIQMFRRTAGIAAA